MKKKIETEPRELFRLSLYIILSGWIVFGAFLLVEYKEYDLNFLKRFFTIEYPVSVLYLVMLLFPFFTTAMGYLINEKGKLMMETFSYKERLEDALSSWRITFDSMPNGAMFIDSGFNILMANDYISRLSNIPLKELVGRKCYSVVHGMEGPIDNCPIKRSAKTLSEETFEFYDKDRKCYFIFHSTPLVSDKGLTFAHSIVDITELKEKEKSLLDARDAFFNMLKDLDTSYRELKSLFDGLIFAFAAALDAKSKWTKGHSERVTSYALSIALEMNLSEKEREILKTAAILHDIGKIGTYDAILDKVGSLTTEERELIKQHPEKGVEILSHIKQLNEAIPVIRHHHERVDGEGYPDRLKGEEIPLLARILCVADAYDSMTEDRPYRTSRGKEFALKELKRCSGSQFDPQVVEAFLKTI